MQVGVVGRLDPGVLNGQALARLGQQVLHRCAGLKRDPEFKSLEEDAGNNRHFVLKRDLALDDRCEYHGPGIVEDRFLLQPQFLVDLMEPGHQPAHDFQGVGVQFQIIGIRKKVSLQMLLSR